jgi:FkbM family methyltransferase
MMRALKGIVRKAINQFAFGSDLQWRRPSYSQEGEDRILERYFGFRKQGFYVDVGAHHPHRFSNTHLFYKRGWRGINIDAAPGSMEPFHRMRRRDINLEIGIGETSGLAKFFIFNEPALNTFDEEMAKAHTQPGWHIVSAVEVKLETLGNILKEHIPVGSKIDFMTIDVEGRDLSVLKSNNWNEFRPELILVESLGSGLTELHAEDIVLFLKDVGYSVFAKTVNTFFFLRGS